MCVCVVKPMCVSRNRWLHITQSSIQNDESFSLLLDKSQKREKIWKKRKKPEGSASQCKLKEAANKQQQKKK